MKAYKEIFARYEEKYIIDIKTMEELISKYKDEIQEDYYAESMIQNIYYDTSDYIILRSALDKQHYKEKLRIRTYNDISDNSMVFIEIKKKSQGIVYKRRTSTPYNELKDIFDEDIDNQVIKEVKWLKSRYNLLPKLFISYFRHSFVGTKDSNFRVTFDTDIKWRPKDLKLQNTIYGYDITPDNAVVMEVKTGAGIPLWFVEFLDSHNIYPTNYSKYKACCIDMMERGIINVY